MHCRTLTTKNLDSDLPRLVQFLLLVASTQVFRNTALALSMLNFVCSVTDVPSSRDFNLQATALRSSIGRFRDLHLITQNSNR